MSKHLASAIYDGRIRHRRFGDVEREFNYEIFMVYLDLDELPQVMSLHPLWSTRPRSPASFRRSDYLGRPDRPLRESVLDLVETRTGVRPDGPVRMLTHLRYWGVCFNPVSFYYCFDPAGETAECVVAEVTNIPWGEKHTYLADERDARGVLGCEVEKELHVSPLMGMDHHYRLRFGDPGRTLSVHMESLREGCLHFDATLSLARRPLTRSNMGRLLLGRVPMPVKVLGGIHLEAARTWLAGAPFNQHPDRAAHAVTCRPAEKAAF